VQITAIRGELVDHLRFDREYVVGLLASPQETLRVLCALEIALNDFARAPDMSVVDQSRLTAEAVASLKSTIEHLGFTVSMRHLVPLLIPDHMLDLKTLSRCHRIIQIRQNVVHTGQRTVQESEVRVGLAAARRACELLRALTITRPDDADV
jgi:hypothetical protein